MIEKYKRIATPIYTFFKWGGCMFTRLLKPRIAYGTPSVETIVSWATPLGEPELHPLGHFLGTPYDAMGCPRGAILALLGR